MITVNGTGITAVNFNDTPVDMVFAYDAVKHRRRKVFPKPVEFGITITSDTTATINLPAYRLRRIYYLDEMQVADVAANGTFSGNVNFIGTGRTTHSLRCRFYRAMGAYYDYYHPTELSMNRLYTFEINEEPKTCLAARYFNCYKARIGGDDITTQSDLYYYVYTDDYDAMPILSVSSNSIYGSDGNVYQTVTGYLNGDTSVNLVSTQSHSQGGSWTGGGWDGWIGQGDNRYQQRVKLGIAVPGVVDSDTYNKGLNVYAGHSFDAIRQSNPSTWQCLGYVYSQDDGHAIHSWTYNGADWSPGGINLETLEYTHITFEEK